MKLRWCQDKLRANKKNLVAFIVIVTILSWLGYAAISYSDSTHKEGDGNRTSAQNNECSGLERGQRIQCWSDTIDFVLENKGIDEALQTLAGIYEREPKAGFAQSCHGLTHSIGEEAYRRFSNGEEFVVTPKSTYCDFGFYHGFMETLLIATGDISKAREFCVYIEAELSGALPGVALQCYHGIGHGVVGVHDPRVWGDARSLANPAVKLCEEVAKNDVQLENCLSGVFNGIGNYYLSGKYGLLIEKEDPLWLCREQRERYKAVCYGLMARVLLHFANYDFPAAVRSGKEAVEETYMMVVVNNLAVLNAGLKIYEKDHNTHIASCKKLTENLRLACLTGYATGLMQFGKPQDEHVEAIAFCQSDALDPEEQRVCFQHTFSYLRNLYSSEKIKILCGRMQGDYQKYCLL